jgi:hypothetical protein
MDLCVLTWAFWDCPGWEEISQECTSFIHVPKIVPRGLSTTDAQCEKEQLAYNNRLSSDESECI